MIEYVREFHFIRPYWLLLFCVFPFFLVQRRVKKERLMPEHLIPYLRLDENKIFDIVYRFIPMLIFILIVLIAAGPTWIKKAIYNENNQGNVQIILDSSQSMTSVDVLPSRFKVAQQKIKEIIEFNEDKFIGLIVYAGSAHTAIPKTRDSSLFYRTLNSISPDIMPIKGDNIELAIKLLKRDDSLERSTIVWVTDDFRGYNSNILDNYLDMSKSKLIVLLINRNDNYSTSKYKIANDLARKTGGFIVKSTLNKNDVDMINESIKYTTLPDKVVDYVWMDMGYYLIYPLSILILFLFRRGLFCLCLVFALNLVANPIGTAQASPIDNMNFTSDNSRLFIDLWFTKEQQTAWYFNNENYEMVINVSDNNIVKGISYYYLKKYMLAEREFLSDGGCQALIYLSDMYVTIEKYSKAKFIMLELINSDSVSNDIKSKLKDKLHYLNMIIKLSFKQIGDIDENHFKPDNENIESDENTKSVNEDNLLKNNFDVKETMLNESQYLQWMNDVEGDYKFFLKMKFKNQLENNSNREMNMKEAK